MTADFHFLLGRHTTLNTWRLPLLPMLLFLALIGYGADDKVPAIAPSNSAHIPSTTVTIPFEFRRGHIVIRSRINESEPLSFMLDSGYSMTMMSAELTDTLKLKRVSQATIVGIAGSEEADVFEGPTFDLAGATYSPRRIGAFPSANKGRSRKRDGVLGSGFFRRFVVEIDHRAKTIQLHEPTNYTYAGSGEIIPLRFRRTTPMVTAEIKRPGRPPVSGQFEIDTGCDGGLCLGHKFVEAHQLVETSGQTEDGVRKGVGGDTRTVIGSLPQFQLGQITIDKPQVNFFLEGSPVDDGLAGHIGIEILRPFKVIFDYSRKQLILESYDALPKSAEKNSLPAATGKSN